MGNSHPQTPNTNGSPNQNDRISPQSRRGMSALRSLRPRSMFTRRTSVDSAAEPPSLVSYHHDEVNDLYPQIDEVEERHLQTPVQSTSYVDSIQSSPAIGFPAFIDTDQSNQDFYPSLSQDWRFRSIESLILGHTSRAPILSLEEYDVGLSDPFEDYCRRRSTASTFGGRRRSSTGGGRRGSLSLHGGTMASYQSRRRPNADTIERATRRGSTQPVYRRRSSLAAGGGSGESETAKRVKQATGTNIIYATLAREMTGKPSFSKNVSLATGIIDMGGTPLYKRFDRPAGNMASEVSFLAAAIDSGDWTETQSLISRLAPRLIGDPTGASSEQIADPNLAPTAPRFHAGGGRFGLERDTFVKAGGVQVLIRMFREKSFVGMEMAMTNDARDLSGEIVATRLAPCWNEALASLRELVYHMPSIVDDGIVLDGGNFLPFLFTLLSHAPCFDNAADLIEEIVSTMSQSVVDESDSDSLPSRVHKRIPTTFFLGNVPHLYDLWRAFNCRQLARFCRILALLIFEPEDRQLLESPSVLKSIELLRLRRNRAVRSGLDSTVDLNQSILLGDEEIFVRLLKIMKVMNYAPPLNKFSPYHVMAHFPFIVDTLIVLGLVEIDSFTEIDRQDLLARDLLADGDATRSLCEIGNVAVMLDRVSERIGNAREDGSFQLNHIVTVISAAHQTGIIGGPRTTTTDENGNVSEIPLDIAALLEGNPLQGFAAVAGILSGGLDYRRVDIDEDDTFGGLDPLGETGETEQNPDYPIRGRRVNTAQEAANSLQFNGMLLGPYQVEVLFVLCTLLGGRRKLDMQDMLEKLRLADVLSDMFQRLPWANTNDDTSASNNHGENGENRPHGPHGPGCECTPESTLCVQYLRLIHNFCDRDCDNYGARQQLLSKDELRLISDPTETGDANMENGLLAKLVAAFIKESDESPYRFWLASCIESFLRGASHGEQLYFSRIGLLDHLVDEISSDRLHCAGSLQTSFDLLGELIKGNHDVISALVERFDEEGFRRFMSVAAANLVDSNVFIRSLILSIEYFSSSFGAGSPLYLNNQSTVAGDVHAFGAANQMYLTHTWLDAEALSLDDDDGKGGEQLGRPSDWYPTFELSRLSMHKEPTEFPKGLQESVGYCGWVFAPTEHSVISRAHAPNSIERMSWFLAANQARLLRDLLRVVGLRNINHENVCCLNTAVVLAIFANRRQQLPLLLTELRRMNKDDIESRQRIDDAKKERDVVENSFVQARRNSNQGGPAYARASSAALSETDSDVVRNFREVLWFWGEYYSHRGRDRLSLEFSSHVRFQEWSRVVKLLSADDGSTTALLPKPIRLPRSPYSYAPRLRESTSLRQD